MTETSWKSQPTCEYSWFTCDRRHWRLFSQILCWWNVFFLCQSQGCITVPFPFIFWWCYSQLYLSDWWSFPRLFQTILSLQPNSLIKYLMVQFAATFVQLKASPALFNLPDWSRNLSDLHPGLHVYTQARTGTKKGLVLKINHLLNLFIPKHHPQTGPPTPSPAHRPPLSWLWFRRSSEH